MFTWKDIENAEKAWAHHVCHDCTREYYETWVEVVNSFGESKGDTCILSTPLLHEAEEALKNSKNGFGFPSRGYVERVTSYITEFGHEVVVKREIVFKQSLGGMPDE